MELSADTFQEELEYPAQEQENVILPPAGVTDPLASQISWTPLQRREANFRTHELVQVASHQLRYQLTRGTTKICHVFMGVGVGAVLLGIYIWGGFVDGRNWLTTWLGICFAVIGFLFALLGLRLFQVFHRPACFDRSCGLFWKGRKDFSALLPAELDGRDDLVRLDQVHALQIIPKQWPGNIYETPTTYDLYELNLVLADGDRIYVIDHGNLQKLRQDAETLSAFLGKPIWDAT